jgi:hypothetical protein
MTPAARSLPFDLDPVACVGAEALDAARGRILLFPGAITTPQPW